MNAIREWARGVMCLGCGLFGLAIAPCARAKGLAGASELQLKTNAFMYNKYDAHSTSTAGSSGVVLPAASSSSSTSSGFGLFGSGSGVGYGYFLTNQLKLGADVFVVHAHTGGGVLGAVDSTNLSLLPRAEYVLGGDRVRPYIAALAGYSHLWSSNDGSYTYSGQSSGFTFGGGVGAHVFLGDSWSIDPELSLQRTIQSGNSTGHGTSDPSSAYETESTSHQTALLLQIGLSGWFGGY